MTNVLIGQTFSTIFKALGWKLVHVILYMLLVPKMLLVALHHIYIYTTMHRHIWGGAGDDGPPWPFRGTLFSAKREDY